jgi:hypothetical protein
MPSLKPAPESPVSQNMAADLDAVYGKIARRIIPFLVLLFLMAWLDRHPMSGLRAVRSYQVIFSCSGLARARPSRESKQVFIRI